MTFDVGRHDPVAQILDESHVSLTPAGVRLAPIVCRYVWPSELDLMAHIAGLRLRAFGRLEAGAVHRHQQSACIRLRALSRHPTRPDRSSSFSVRLHSEPHVLVRWSVYMVKARCAFGHEMGG